MTEWRSNRERFANLRPQRESGRLLNPGRQFLPCLLRQRHRPSEKSFRIDYLDASSKAIGRTLSATWSVPENFYKGLTNAKRFKNEVNLVSL
jgi:hypothetical protein